ncbi:peptidase T [Pedobacter yulinensis]|uniref:Peptidase T n=1 Tax=Pedobacter yulinensis TaxID=2126353 RepID=A0A2T3HRX1_9SPHI|nr:peptidase T [Pedobacter yulinensis]PST85188.1 peptidase T [Pedobacter yulinensis]
MQTDQQARNPLEARFMRYVQVDTQSDPTSPSCPSTEKQKDLGAMLATELRDMGLSDAHLDDFGYVYATLPGNSGKKVPVICFCSHMDTSPDSPGAGVKPLIHRNYDGRDLMLPDDPAVVIRESAHPDLRAQHGNDIITASGLTLLGADNKAGIAAIMEALSFLVEHSELKHGTIRVLFTPDEEIGRGVDQVDMQKLAADFGYTIDGETLGSIEDETFSADGAVLKIAGVSSHPGFAKGKMENAMQILAEVLTTLPKDRLRPEVTESKEGFIHPVSIKGEVEQAEAHFILRDFDDTLLEAHGKLLRETVESVMRNYPASTHTLEIRPQYRNMKNVLDRFPHVVAYGEEAISRSGIEVKKRSIRGGTDGSRLSFMGLPCPNIFAGEHAFHSRQEWVSVQDMQKAAEVIVNLAQIWEERS